MQVPYPDFFSEYLLGAGVGRLGEDIWNDSPHLLHSDCSHHFTGWVTNDGPFLHTWTPLMATFDWGLPISLDKIFLELQSETLPHQSFFPFLISQVSDQWYGLEAIPTDSCSFPCESLQLFS